MIRRELKAADGTAKWLLVSQVEHARISGVLARHWRDSELSPYEIERQRLPEPLTEQIIAAVVHHDDGWARWEETPGLDPANGRPYTFMNELPLEESLRIWDDSIDSARRFGPLAGWLVASHFYELLRGGTTSDANRARWLNRTDQRRGEWLREWRQTNDSTRAGVAERGLRLLQACDVLSLWLFCDCPVLPDETGDDAIFATVPWPEAGGRSGGPAAVEAGRRTRTNTPPAHPGWFIAGTPWPFDRGSLALAATAWLAPVRQYGTSEELLAARQSVNLGWHVEAPA